MLPGVGALLQDLSARRQDHHHESLEHTHVAGWVDRVDDRSGTLNVHRDPGVRWDVDALELKQEPADGHRAVHRNRIPPQRFAAVGFQRSSRGGGEHTGR